MGDLSSISVEDRKRVFNIMVDRWHDDEDTDLELHEYMGLSWKEYCDAIRRGGYM